MPHQVPYDRLFISSGVLAVLVALALQITAIYRQSLVADEPFFLLSGYRAVHYGSNTLNLEHPPLVKMLAALPLSRFSGPDENPSQLIFRDRTHATYVRLASRFVLLVTVAIPFLIGCFLLGREIATIRVGVTLALSLAFSFDVIPYLTITQTDAAVSLGYVLTEEFLPAVARASRDQAHEHGLLTQIGERRVLESVLRYIAKYGKRSWVCCRDFPSLLRSHSVVVGRSRNGSIVYPKNESRPMLALVWTLPVQKALLLVGLFWAHGRALQHVDVLTLIPETAVAALVSGMFLQWSAQHWLRVGLAWVTCILVTLSWLVIAAWIVAGAPLSYQMLGMLISEPAVLKTATASPAVLFQLLAFAGGVPILWMVMRSFHYFVKRWMISLWWQPRRMSFVLVGLGIVGLLSVSSDPTQTTRLALLTPLFNEQTLRSFSREQLDPATLAVLQPPQRRSQGLSASLIKRPHVVLIVLESIRWQAGSLFDRGFPQAVHFDRVYAHDPRSIKTLEALLFGIYPSPTQVTAAWSIDKYAVEQMSPLPRLLRAQGYETTYYAAMDPSYDNYGAVMKVAGIDQVKPVSGEQQLTWGQGDVATVLKRVTERLEHGVRHQKSQFIIAWTAECHIPYDYVGGQSLASPREQYLACHHSLAQSIEAFIQQLERDRRLNDTLVVVLGDHGEIFPEEKAGEWGHGFYVYEPSVRIPVLLFIPGVVGGRHDTRLFQPVDISSTLLDQLNLPVPQSWVGRNMIDVAEPGRDFVLVVNSVANGAIGIIEATGKKYVRRVLGGPLLSYDLKVDPTEQVELRVSQAMAEAVTRKIETYLSFVAHQWESRRAREAVSPYTWPGKMLNQWVKGTCVTIAPDEEAGTASVQPVRSPECDQADGPEKRVFFRPLPRAPFEEGVRIQLELRIDVLADPQGRQLRAWGKASIAEPIMSTTVRPVVGEWQTVSLSLPKLAPTTDPKDTRESADILFMMTPLDVPAQYTLRSVTIEPVSYSLPDRLRAWWAERLG